MRLLRRATIGTVGFTLALGLTLTPASAETPIPTPAPTPTGAPSSTEPRTAAEARVVVDRLRAEQQQIEGRAAEVEKRLSDTSDRIDEKSGDIAEQENKIKAAKKRLAQIALNQYQDRDADSATALLLNGGDTQDFLDSLSAADNIAENNATLLAEFEAQQASLADDKRALEAEEASAKKDYAELDSLRKQSAQKVTEAQAVVDRLDKAEREAFLKAEAERRAQEEKARQDPTSRTAPPRDSSTDTTATATDDATSANSDNVGVENPYPAPKVPMTGYNGYAFGNCTAYAFSRRKQIGRPVMNGWHNAKQWPAAARAAGYVVDSRPEVGAAYVTFRGYYGHVMVVEKLNGDGSFIVSEMNYHGGPGTGFNRISTRLIPRVGGVFIH